MGETTTPAEWECYLEGASPALPRSAGGPAVELSPAAPGGPPVTSDAGPVVLVRYRRGIVGETSRTVHIVEPSTAVPGAGVVSALCGAVLTPGELEVVALRQGMPCMACVFRRVTDTG